MRRNRKKYLSKYYSKNKSKLNNDKSEKYLNNLKYRNDALLRSRLQSVMRILNNINKNKVKFNGNIEKVYYLTDISEIVNRSTLTLRSWIKQNIIPESLFKDNNGLGLYTESQVLFLQALLKKVDLGEVFTFDDLKTILNNIWSKTFSINTLEFTIKFLNNK